MSIKSANKAQAAELLPPSTVERAPIMSSGIVPSSNTSMLSSSPTTATTAGAVCAPMQNVLVYVGNDNYAHAYTVNNTAPLSHNAIASAAATGPYQLHHQQQQRQNHHHHHHHQSSGSGGKFYPSNPTYLQHHNGYKPFTVTDQNNLVRYLVSTTDTASTDYLNNQHIVLNRCNSVKSEAAESSCSSLSSPEDQHLLMGVDSNQGNNNGNNSGGGVTVTSSASGVVPVLATVAPPVQAQPPLGTAVGVGGNVATGTAVASALGAAPPVPCVFSGNVVNVPHGWQRLVSNGAIIYVSPSNIVLATSTQAKDYLQTAGTCKCGLECPFHFDSTFNFDVKVIGKPSLLTPDINVDLTKLCNHKRKLQSLATPEAKMLEPANDNQTDYGSQKKKPKISSINKKLVKVTTATSTMPPYHSPGATISDASVANNNASNLLHPLDSSPCSTSASSTFGGPQFAQQHQQQLWPNQLNGPSLTPTTAQRLSHPSAVPQQPLFTNSMDPTQSYYGYPSPQPPMLPPQGYPPALPQGPPNPQPHPPSGGYPTSTSASGGDLTSQLHIPSVATNNPMTHPTGGAPGMMSAGQLVPSTLVNGSSVIGSQKVNVHGNHLLSGPPTVDQSGPGRPPTTLSHPTAHPNNIRLPHPMCYDPTTTAPTAKHHQATSGIRLPVPYPNMPQPTGGMRLPKQQPSSWNYGPSGMMRCPAPPLQQQQHNGNIYDRVPPLPQHLQGTGEVIQNGWVEEVSSGRKKPASKTNPNRAQKKPRPNYHLLIDTQHQQPCPNVEIRQMSGQTLQQQQQQHNNLVQQQQSGFNTTTSGLENCGTNSMITTASPSFIDDPSGYLAQQTALLNSTISGQGLQMNGFPSSTPPPLTQTDPMRSSTSNAPAVAAVSKQPPPYQHHRITSKQQQQQHFSGGQVFISHQQQQVPQHQQLHQIVVNGGVVVTSENQQGHNAQGRCTDCLISGQDETAPLQLQMVGSKRCYSRVGRVEAALSATNEDPVTSSTFFDHPLPNTPNCSSTSSSKSTNSTTSSYSGSRSQSRPLPSVSSPDSRPIQGGTISTSNVSPQHDTSSNSSVVSVSGISSPPQQQHQQQIVLSKMGASQHGVLNGNAPRLCVTSMSPNITNIVSGVRTLHTQALPLITSPTITLTPRPGVNQQLSQQFHLTTSPSHQHHQHQQLVALAAAASSANVCNGTTAVVVSSGANGTLVAKSPLEMVQSVVIKSPTNHHHHHQPNTLPPGHILVSSGGQLLMASTTAPVSNAQQHHQQQQAVAQAVAQAHHLMAPPPPKQQLAMPPMSVSPMVTNVTASVTQVIPTVAQQVLGQQTVLVNALPTPSFLLQPGVTMTMDGLANLQNLQQFPHLLTANNLLHHHQPNQAAAALMSPTQDILSALAKSNNGASSPGAAIGTSGGSNAKKGKKRKSGGGPVLSTNNNVANVTAGLVAQPVTSMLHIAAAGNGAAGVVSPQSFTPQLQMHSPQTPVMQALTIVPGKGGGPPQLVMNTSPAQATTQHINLLQPVNLLNNTTGMHIQNYPTIQQFILPNLGGMVVNADGTATILPATAAASSAQAAADAAAHHAQAHPLQMQLQLQHVNGQNILTPVATHPGGHITFSSPPTNNTSGLSMLIRPAISKQTPTMLQHSPSATAQFLSPNGAATGTTATGQQFLVNGATFTGGQLSPLVTAAGISPRATGAGNGGEYGQATLMVPCTPVSSNGGNTYVHQNTTIVQQQTTMVTNNNQPPPPQQHTTRTGNNQINLRPAPAQQTTTLNVNLNEQNQFIISDKSLILQTQAQLQHHHHQQQQQQQARQQRLNINQTMNLISQAAAATAQAQYRQSVSTQTITGFQQVPTTVTTPNTFCQTSNAIASSLSASSITAGGTPQASSTPPTPGSPPDTTTLSPLTPQPTSHIHAKDNVVIGGNGTTILTSSFTHSATTNNNSTARLSIGGGQSPMPGADTTTYSGHSTDDGLSPAPSNCSSVGTGSNGSYAVSSGTPLTVGSTHHRQQQSGTMAMVQCVSSSEPDISEFTFIEELDWTKNNFTVQNQSSNQFNQRSNKKDRNTDVSVYTDNTTFKIEKEIKSNDCRRTYSNSHLSKSSIDLLQYGNNPQMQNQRQTTTLNYPESASTVQYVTGNNAYDTTTEAIIVQNNYGDNLSRNTQQRACNQTASTVILDHIGGSYANNIVDELLKQQQLEALQSKQHQQKDPLLKSNTRNKYEKLHQQQEQRRKQQQINNIRQTIAALFDDEDDDSNNEVSTTKDTIQSTIDSVLSEETSQLDESEPDSKLDGRTFAVGDLVWAPAHGCPAWPGQIVADTDNGKELAIGHVLVRWFGDNGTATTSSVAAQTLCTLTQGLELHHLARKRARTSRKLNSQLEKAIQQAMTELDKISDNKTVVKYCTSLSTADGSAIIKEKKTSERFKKSGLKLGTNKELTTVKKSSSRLRSQR